MRTRDTAKEELVKQKAMELFVDDGFEAFSMQRLARECNISVGTLYIYYKNKTDLICKIGIEEGTRLHEFTLKGFSADMSFAEGLKKQWENRAKYWLKNPKAAEFMEVLKHSEHGDFIAEKIASEFRPVMKQFTLRAIENGELVRLPLEVYWSIAFGPLYTLIHFHQQKRSLAGKPFKFSNKLMYHSLELVLKALRP